MWGKNPHVNVGNNSGIQLAWTCTYFMCIYIWPFVFLICWYICIRMYNRYIYIRTCIQNFDIDILICLSTLLRGPRSSASTPRLCRTSWHVGTSCCRPGTSHWCHWCRCWSSWRHQNSLMEASWWCLASASFRNFSVSGRTPTFKCLDGTWRNPSCYSTTFND